MSRRRGRPVGPSLTLRQHADRRDRCAARNCGAGDRRGSLSFGRRSRELGVAGGWPLRAVTTPTAMSRSLTSRFCKIFVAPATLVRGAPPLRPDNPEGLVDHGSGDERAAHARKSRCARRCTPPGSAPVDVRRHPVRRPQRLLAQPPRPWSRDTRASARPDSSRPRYPNGKPVRFGGPQPARASGTRPGRRDPPCKKLRFALRGVTASGSAALGLQCAAGGPFGSPRRPSTCRSRSS